MIAGPEFEAIDSQERFDSAPFEAQLAERLAAMRSLVAAMKTETDAEALKLLREAFPGSRLTERVAALAGRGR